ncbi:unnamed protein product [Closterium sp. NIES-65]|nr:unnamed protein product [Closterium sp. NIES-65]
MTPCSRHLRECARWGHRHGAMGLQEYQLKALQALRQRPQARQGRRGHFLHRRKDSSGARSAGRHSEITWRGARTQGCTRGPGIPTTRAHEASPCWQGTTRTHKGALWVVRQEGSKRNDGASRRHVRTALDAPFRRDHNLPAAHDAHAHLHSSERATAGEMGRVGAGDQVIGPRDEESRVAGALTAAANAQTGTEGEKRAEQAIDNVWLGDRASGDNATGGPEIGSSMPRGEVNVVSAVIAASEAIEARRDVPHGDSPARHRAPLSNGDEANVPGAGAGPGR